MRNVSRPVARAAALIVVAPFLTFVSALASQHIHEPEPGHDHEHAVTNSHFAPHHAEALSIDHRPPTTDHRPPASDHRSPATDQDLDHDDALVVWLDSSTLHESPYQVQHALAAVPISFEAVHVEPHWSVTPFDDAAPVHGPPRQPSLFRGPPPLAV